MYEVIVLKEGYNTKEGPGEKKVCGTVTLLKGLNNVIVNTGNPWDKDLILEGLKKHSLSADGVQFVVCTHGHPDHVGNLNLFTNAIHIMSNDICTGDSYLVHAFKQGIPYEIDNHVEVISTPGHANSDVSVVIKNTPMGTVVVTGDLFECKEDLEDYTLWQDESADPETQLQNRMAILGLADWIVPGHGAMFQVPNEYKQQMRMAMYYEHVTAENSGGLLQTSSHVEYIVSEDD